MPRRRKTKRQEHKEVPVVLTPAQTSAIHNVEEEEEGVLGYEEEGGVTDLPWEVWVAVLHFLPCGDVGRFSQTCRIFNAVADMGMVWRERTQRDCWRAAERWGWGLADPSKVGWKTIYQIYKRLTRARLNVDHFCASPYTPVYRTNQSYGRSSFEVENNFQCLAVDEVSFTPTPDVVALGIFGISPSSDCVQLWRHKGPNTPAPKPVLYGRKPKDQNWELWRGLKGHKSTVSCMKFMDGTNRLITGSWDRTIKVWDNVTDDTKQPSCVATFAGHAFEVNCIARHQSLLASGAQDRTVALWDMDAGKRVHTFEGHSLFVESVAFDREGQLLMSGSSDKTVRVWDPRAGPKEVKSYDVGGPVRSIALNSDGERLYYCPFPALTSDFEPWIDLKAQRMVLNSYIPRWRPFYQVARAERMAVLQYRLESGFDFLAYNGTIVKVPLDGGRADADTCTCTLATWNSSREVSTFDGRSGVCWTNSQVVVAGGQRKVYIADMAVKGLVVDPEAVKEDKEQCRERLRSLAAAQVEKKKQAISLPTAPSPEEVEKDVARIARQIATIQRERRKRSH